MITVLRKNLLKAVSEVKSSYHSKSLPVLNHVLLYCGNGALRLTTTNLDESKTATCSAKIEQPFAACIPQIIKWQEKRYNTKNKKFEGYGSWHTGYPLYDWLKATDDEVLTLALDENNGKLTIKAGNTKATFKCLPATEFPPKYRPSDSELCTVAKTEPAQAEPEPVKVEIVTTYRSPRKTKTVFSATKPEPQQEPDPRAVILAKYAWIAEWEADPKKRFYKSTIHNARINLRDELAALDAPIDITAELAAIKTQSINAR